jgi:hypothetical protein
VLAEPGTGPRETALRAGGPGGGRECGEGPSERPRRAAVYDAGLVGVAAVAATSADEERRRRRGGGEAAVRRR